MWPATGETLLAAGLTEGIDTKVSGPQGLGSLFHYRSIRTQPGFSPGLEYSVCKLEWAACNLLDVGLCVAGCVNALQFRMNEEGMFHGV